jgi:hypothetical protein
LSHNEFQRLLADRTISFKLRSTIDYSEHDMDKSFMKQVEKRAEEVANGTGTNRRKMSNNSSVKEITEDD